MIQMAGRLTEADHKSHVLLDFQVPPGTGRLAVHVEMSPRRARGAFFDNMVCLSLWGPAGPRGARHNNPDPDFEIAADRATPGFLPGPIEPGRWQIGLDVFRLLGPDPVDYRLDIDFGPVSVGGAGQPLARRTRPRGPGWYRGDLHAHSLHSDGSWDVPDLVSWARTRELDFLALTDHNTISGHAALHALASDDLLTLGGMEMTTHHGHAVTLGAGWHEWRSGPSTGLGMADLARAAQVRGALYTIAHPMSPGDDQGCTGCRWEFADMRPGPATQVEIWNGGPWSDYNEEGLALFRTWLSAGHRLVATAGSDIHGEEGGRGPIGFNHVEAEALTEAAILSAVAQGRNYLSSGPRLILTAEAADRPVPMGGLASAGAPLHVHWQTGALPLWLHVVDAGGRRDSLALPPESRGLAEFPQGFETFVQAELRDGRDGVHAVTNPIFFG